MNKYQNFTATELMGKREELCANLGEIEAELKRREYGGIVCTLSPDMRISNCGYPSECGTCGWNPEEASRRISLRTKDPGRRGFLEGNE